MFSFVTPTAFAAGKKFGKYAIIGAVIGAGCSGVATYPFMKRAVEKSDLEQYQDLFAESTSLVDLKAELTRRAVCLFMLRGALVGGLAGIGVRSLLHSGGRRIVGCAVMGTVVGGGSAFVAGYEIGKIIKCGREERVTSHLLSTVPSLLRPLAESLLRPMIAKIKRDDDLSAKFTLQGAWYGFLVGASLGATLAARPAVVWVISRVQGIRK